MNIRSKLILVILILSAGTLFGQSVFKEGYIINLKNDTIQGKIDYRSNLKNYESCIFRGDDEGEKKYLPHQIKGFGFDNDKFFSSQVINEAFVEVIVVGDMSLYKFKDVFLIKKDTAIFELKSIFEEKEINGKIVKRKKSEWRGILTYLISDCLSNANSLVSGIGFNEKPLTKLIVKYNKCKGSEFKEIKVSKPWTQIDFGVAIGMARSEIKDKTTFSFSYLSDSYSSLDPSIGVLLNISFPRLTEKISSQGEIHFIKSSYSSMIENNYTNFTDYYYTFIDLTTLSIPLSAKYTFPEKKFGFYFQGGINIDYHLKSETKFFGERITGGVVQPYPEEEAFEVQNSQIGYWGGAAIYKSFTKFRGSVSVRYFQMSKLNTDALTSIHNSRRGLYTNINRISLNLILMKI